MTALTMKTSNAIHAYIFTSTIISSTFINVLKKQLEIFIVKNIDKRV